MILKFMKKPVIKSLADRCITKTESIMRRTVPTPPGSYAATDPLLFEILSGALGLHWAYGYPVPLFWETQLFYSS